MLRRRNPRDGISPQQAPQQQEGNASVLWMALREKENSHTSSVPLSNRDPLRNQHPTFSVSLEAVLWIHQPISVTEEDNNKTMWLFNAQPDFKAGNKVSKKSPQCLLEHSDNISIHISHIEMFAVARQFKQSQCSDCCTAVRLIEQISMSKVPAPFRRAGEEQWEGFMSAATGSGKQTEAERTERFTFHQATVFTHFVSALSSRCLLHRD
ncbi:uncharacterized protein LOC127356035 [Dicentrarchus labrax]|uniref:uncharacterized protein LOC127356035 n=1 Tax=Dicentrarchus labrax TaxID=13489 RepID=UPI0021F521A7|nr:uncharacterized protein LOC127356035 [Dicentrarchus labrax]